LADIDFVRLFVFFLVLLISLTVHEAAHAWSADRLGDSTARALGRVSLNPAVHIDPIGTIVFPLVAMLTGFPLIGWAKPVPVGIRNLGANWRERFMLIAAAGPASNLVIAVVAALAFHALAPGDFDGSPGLGPSAVLAGIVELNVLLAVFNMIPVPPLDGGNVLSGLLRGPAADVFDNLRPYGFLILYALMFTGVFSAIVTPVQTVIFRLLGL
jgi:Zn-dependent protease